MSWPDQAAQAAIKQCVARVSAIGALQTETAAELDAMLPAILDKAFKGYCEAMRSPRLKWDITAEDIAKAIRGALNLRSS